MSILSVSFLIYLCVGVCLYHLLPLKIRPFWLLCLNFFFYLSFDHRYLLFLLFTALTCYLCSLTLEKISRPSVKKFFFGLTLSVNFLLLLFLKFSPYVSQRVFSLLGTKPPSFFTDVLVPVGISFYTLQIASYLIDVYKGKIRAERNPFRFMSFCTFFPLMLQGPISRYDQLAPQLFPQKKSEHVYHDLTFGAQLILWGFFKKLVIADRAAIVVNAVFDAPSEHSGLTVVMAVLLYTLQIYTDFSGCVDICRGAAQMLGIEVIQNFRQPYFATSVQDFWKRWHMSLSGWFRDYIYIPLGGNRKGVVRKYLNVLIVFFISGIWHGVGVHFLVWGILHGVYQIIGALTLPLKKRVEERLSIQRDQGLWLWMRRGITLILISLSWLVFRVNSTRSAVDMFFSMFSTARGSWFPKAATTDLMILAVSVLLLIVTSYYREQGVSIRKKVAQTPLPVRWSLYLVLFAVVLVLGVYGPGFSSSSFIYMNF